MLISRKSIFQLLLLSRHDLHRRITPAGRNGSGIIIGTGFENEYCCCAAAAMLEADFDTGGRCIAAAIWVCGAAARTNTAVQYHNKM